MRVVDEYDTELLSAQDAGEWGRRVVSSLRSSGVPERSFIVFQAQSSAALLAAVYGCLRSHLAPVVISSDLSDYERDAMLNGLPYTAILRDVDLREMCAATDVAPAVLSAHDACRPVHFTSGTSGRPKGVWSGWLSVDDAEALAREEVEAWGFARDDVHLVSGPLSHSAPLRFALQTVSAGGAVLIPKKFDPHVASGLMEDQATTTFMAPIHLQRILDAAPPQRSSLRLLAHAGSHCPELVRRRAIACFGPEVLVEFYGSTEGQFTRCGAEEWLEHPGTVGKARDGRTLRSDEDGRLWCRAPSYARFEYWNDPEKTKNAWDGAWFNVGDLGRVDDEGYVFLEGRRNDLIITGGVNVYPAEIELVLSVLEGIDDLVAFGSDDAQWGQRVCVAFVGPASAREVLAFAMTHFASYKRPKSIIKVSDLPRTHTGKIDRSSLFHLLDSDPTTVERIG
ncbi:MAG TPA: AMP-binding protein [Acidimicrobiales bacterium]|nr:AMP-binding protein [Acidimicrobiales bacterium]